MAQVEPMDIDNVGNDFDDKENSLQNSNFLPRTPCTEKGYEELDVSELNMKLRYSITPASSPMSKSFTASCKDNKTYNFDEDSLNSTIVNNNSNISRSLNSSITKCDVVLRSPKLPLQALTTDKYEEMNSSVRQTLDNDITITVNGIDNIDENFSLPSTTSSTAPTPEATTPTKDIPKGDSGSPIMRGLKSVLNMFRSSQSPIPPEDNIDQKDSDTHSVEEPQIKPTEVLASTPKANKNNDINSSKRSSPLKESVVFNDDLERELQWKDETTIIFKQEKMPIHKLFLQQTTSQALDKKITAKTNELQHLNSTVEYMDISCNESGIGDKTTDVESQINGNNVEAASSVESDGEFLDCETTYTKNEQNDLKQQSSSTNIEKIDLTQELCDEINVLERIKIQVTEDIRKDSEIIQTAYLSHLENNEVNNKELECDIEVVNEYHETDVNVPLNLQKELAHDGHFNKDMNLTSVLDSSANIKKELDGNIKQPDILLDHIHFENKDIKINYTEEQNDLISSNINEEIVDQINEEQLNLDVTMPLNIVTDCQENTLLNKNNDFNNFILVNKENIELEENKSPQLNKGILQICKEFANHTVQEHINRTLDFNAELEDCIDEKNVENDNISNTDKHLPKNCTDLQVNNCEQNEIFNSMDQNTQKFDHNTVEACSLNEDPISIFDSIKNQSQNNDKINDFGHIDLQGIENYINFHDLPVDDVNNLPSDIPLPSDDDIEKDSLMYVKNDDIDTDNNFDCSKINYIKDSLECMDGTSEKAVITDIERISKDLTNISSTSISPLPDSDEMHENLLASENVSNSTNCDLTNEVNKMETIQESTPVALPNNEINMSVLATNEVHQCLNNVEAENQSTDDMVSIATHTEHQSINYIIYNQQVESEELEKKDCFLNEEKVKILNKIELKDNKSFDEEIITSANNSPYVSVNDFDLNVPKLDDIESPFKTNCKIAVSPPISPKLPQKGYNINFDEIDDPFATKTNIRMSPPPETSPNNSIASMYTTQKKIDIKNRVHSQNRRKSQPERAKTEISKKRFNSSYNFDTRTNNCKKQIDAPLIQDDTKEVHDTNQINDLTTTTVPDFENIKTLVVKESTVNNFNISNKSILHSDEPLIVEEDTTSFNIEPTPLLSLPKNVFNLPEIDDMNFNPFATKSKICASPTPTLNIDEENTFLEENKTPSDSHTSTENTQERANLTLNLEENIQEDKVASSDVSSETCSLRNTDKDLTVREIHTEDEDTVEGPFLEVEEIADVVKVSDFDTESDMMQFEDLHADVNNENKEDGELFIDAEAFEFLLNQNKCNVVADSGKESLFLKFDPLFAKRVSSDGVLAALNRIQKRQSTPKKTLETANLNNTIDVEKPSVSASNVGTVFEDNNDETIIVSKPMMVVNPAINSLVSPRKSITPPRINRRSLTFTSPAMAVIDRLLSLSGNSSHLEQDTTSPRANREYNETDIALTQLRELLAEKEIHVHNLRSESKELKERLATMESQVKTLEKETEQRLRKVNDLNERLADKTKINKSMSVVVEEYERTIASLIAEMQHEKKRNADERTRLISERDEQTAHLSSMEVSFSDLHSKYEKSKQIILSMKANEDTYRKSIKEFEDNLLKMQNNYELLKQHATSKLNHANQELEKFNRAHESEVLKLNAMIKRKELHITSLEESLAQKSKANEELTAICDELINKVG